ncbi:MULTISPECIES: NAD(P)/FAD-dependent oxidoreductase [Acidovorax]|uniref:NAD(P)/FAD-dependent oxidoreductase n=1 Tax=Acidovorax facilis TaxID=12917 RepID=A0ABV8DJL7_9BURK|nr:MULTISPECIES: FAD-dependent oxidoreductase [Acidovorax]KQB57145.1 NAD/FAD-dependent oxidoreductase [Acidovorax sp. SD340]MBO1009582.1 NAD(P)-binding protein [Acidovorax sp. SD340]MCO4243336.1 NAD(P)-binding protein [Acidovorax facilis]
MSLATPQTIAVIGAGLAGLSCAQALLQAGHTVHVFDKARGPSGRMSTRRAEDDNGPWQCDHGAQYFTARNPAFRAEVARWQQAGVAALWNARLASFDGTAWTTPATPLERFVGTPRMTSPAAWLVQHLGEPALAQWQTTVQRLDHTEGGWAITSAEHGLHSPRYSAVLLAVPAPQAVPLLAPVSPAGAAIAASARMRGSWAVMLRYASPVALPWEGAFINTGPLRWVARDSSKPGRTGQETWLLHASPEWSEAHIEDSAESVTTSLLAAFAALGGPAPLAATAHRWRYADTQPALTQGSWWDAQMRLGLCGDWLHGGKVEGAWLSGRALAQQVLKPA